MSEENKKRMGLLSYRHTLLWLLLLAALALLGIALCLIAYFLDVAPLLFVGLALSALSALLFPLILVINLKSLERETEKGKATILAKIDELMAFDTEAPESHPIPLSPLSEIDAKIDEAQNYFSGLIISSASKQSDSAKFVCPEILSKTEFKRQVGLAIQTNLSYRSALLLIESQNDDEAGIDVLTLEKAVQAAFAGEIIGRHDARTFAVYLHSVDSFAGLEAKCSSFITSFCPLHQIEAAEDEYVNHVHIGGAVYPYTPFRLLFETAERRLSAANPLSIEFFVSLDREEYRHPPQSELGQKSQRLKALEYFQRRVLIAKSSAEQVEILKNLFEFMIHTTGFDAGGVYLHDRLSRTYENLFEVHRSAECASLLRLGKTLPESVLDPYFEGACRDFFFLGDVDYDLSSELSAPLKNLGLKTYYFISVYMMDNKVGLIYFTGHEAADFGSISLKEDFNGFAPFTCSIVSSLTMAKSISGNSRLLETMAAHAGDYLYTVNRESYQLTYLSENLRRAFPNAKEGDVCYKVLRSAHDMPCSNCPLHKGASKRIISALGPQESLLSVLDRDVSGNESTIIIEPIRVNAVSYGSKLMDVALQIRNDQSLSIDLSREIKGKSRGYLLSFRVLSFQKLLSSFPSESEDSIMESVVRRLTDKGYGELMYRLSGHEITFMLRGYAKSKTLIFAEEVAESLQAEYEFMDQKARLEYAYSSVSYPVEVTNARTVVSLIKQELDRSEKTFGPGHIAEVSNKFARLAYRPDYVRSVLQDTLDRDKMPITIQPEVDGSTLKAKGGDIRSALFGPDKQAIAPSEFIPIADKTGLVARVDIASLSMMGQMYERYAYTAFSTLGIRSLAMYLSMESLNDPEFPDKVRDIFIRYQFPSGYVRFEIPQRFVVERLDQVRSALSRLSGLGLEFSISEYNPDAVDVSMVKSLGFLSVKTERHLIWQAVGNDEAASSLKRLVTDCRKANIAICIAGIESEEQIAFAKQLGVDSLEGYAFGKPMGENEFIQAISYAK